jgi:hypothetical protein
MSTATTPEPSSKRRLTRKQRSIVLGVVGLLTTTAVAFGFYTTTGDGTGSTRAGTSTDLVIHAAITPATGGIVPGGPASDVAFTVDNAGTGNQLVDTIHLESVQAFSDALHAVEITGTGAGECDTSHFSVPDVTATQNVASGTGIAITAHGSLTFADSGINQDTCKLAYLLLTFSSN